MRKYIVYILLLINCNILQNDLSAQPIKKDYSRQVDSLLQQMTLEEKVGQMIQYSNDKLQTGPTIKNQNHVEEIKKGMVGSMFNIITVERARQYQDLAMQSRLKIPLIFGLDVVHGMRTIFPIPLGEAASFDLKRIKKTARIALPKRQHTVFLDLCANGRYSQRCPLGKRYVRSRRRYMVRKPGSQSTHRRLSGNRLFPTEYSSCLCQTFSCIRCCSRRKRLRGSRYFGCYTPSSISPSLS